MIKKLIIPFFCFFVLISNSVFGAKETIISSVSGSKIKTLAASPTSLYSLMTEDQKWNYMAANQNWVCQFGNKSSNVSVILRFDDSKRNYENVDWNLTVTYDIKLYSLSSPGAGQSVVNTIYTGQVATIDFNKTTSYNDVFLKMYEGAYKAEVTITNVVWTPSSGSVLNVLPVKYDNDVFFDVVQETERYYNMYYNGTDCTPATLIPPVLTTNVSAVDLNQTLLTNNELPIAWSYIQGAESYDLEWLFIDIGKASYGTTFNLDFTKATRVNVTNQSFNIPMAYPRGILVYRVRAIGNSHNPPYVGRIEGPWSVNGANTSNLVSTNGSSYLKNYDGLDLDYNWQYSASYAEDGKHKEVINYFDGSLRNRQTTTILNTDNNAVIAETKYDFQGRPTVQMLPTPFANSGIHFYSNFNPGFSKELFDIDGNYPSSGPSPATVPSSDQTAAYYGNNPTATGSDVYVPNAQGVPFTQVKYKTDGTGRVVAQSGVGPDHKLGSGHDTRYYYGTPAGQEELDRLFGNEVGNVSHYKKNLMIDANGQVSVTYLDQEGRVIATALSGNAPANLMDIDNKPAAIPIVSDMLTGKNNYSGNSRVLKTSILTSKVNTSYTFDYLLNVDPSTVPYTLNVDTACYSYVLDPANPSQICKICEDCIYDLEIRILDDEGKNLAATITPTSSATYNGAVVTGTINTTGGVNSLIKLNQIETAIYKITVNFPEIGSYYIEKTIRISQTGLDLAKSDFTTAVQSPPCGPLVEDAAIAPCNNCDYICNKQYGVYAPTYITPVVVPNPPPITTDKYGHLLSTLSQEQQDQALVDYNSCYNACSNIAVNIPDECALKAHILFTDMSPGGQYFDNIEDQIYTCSPHPTPNCSPSNPAYNKSACINNWLSNMEANNPNFSWSNFYTFVTTSANCSPAVTVSQGTFEDWTWIRDNWQSCFAKYLIQFHPEYCNFSFYCGDLLLCTLPGEASLPVFTETSNGTLGTTTTQTVTMHNSNLFDKVFKNDNLNLFTSPIQPTGSGAEGYISDLKNSPTIPGSWSITEYVDPLFYLSQVGCEPDIYCTTDESRMKPSTLMTDALTKFHLAAVNSGGSPIPMSIWYVLDDPDNIRNITSTSYVINGSAYLPNGTTIDQSTLDFFQSYHGPTGILSQSGSTKYDIYKNYYFGRKKFILYAIYNTNYNCANDQINGEYIAPVDPIADAVESGFTSCSFDAVTNTLPHAQIRFPKNQIFDIMLSSCPDFNYTSMLSAIDQNTTTALASACESSCEGNADIWINEIKAKIAACSLGVAASNSLTVLSNIRHDLVEICISSCDGTNYMGLDHIPASPTNPNLPAGVLTFQNVLTYYLSVSPYNTCTNLISSIDIVHPPQASSSSGFSQASCICDNIKDFALAQNIAWDLSNSNLPNLIATAMNNELDLDATHTVSSTDVCVWMSNCFQGTGSCLSSGTPPLDINYLIVQTGSGITNKSVPDVLQCPATNEIPENDPCNTAQAEADAAYGDSLMEAQAVNQLLAIFQANYINRCLGKLDEHEHMMATYSLDEYYYTLYYYDQAGNLIKTIPPEGFRPLVVSQTSNPANPTTKDVALHRLTPGSTPFIWSNHHLVTNYKYNTLDQIREQLTPDGGKSNFYYDIVGRLVISQNAKQAALALKAYSYTLYDELSRIKEVGEIGSASVMTDDKAKTPNDLASFINVPIANKHQITRTYHDEAPSDLFGPTTPPLPYQIQSNKTRGLYASGMLGYLRNRVACVTYTEDEIDHSSYSATTKYYDNASHFSYDIHGNVSTLYIENTELSSFGYDLNKIDYNYDLISGKVNEVHYNSGKVDQFHHKYQYDADNRITKTLTSRNGIIWEKESKYFYYKHGLLYRTEIGDKQVQATDYAYTIHGWIKGVNNNSLDVQNDIGLDGYKNASFTNLNSNFAKDAFGYSLGYYQNDYVAKNPTNVSFIAPTTAIQSLLYPGAPNASSQGAQLFNGNIANMVTNIYLKPSATFVTSPIIKSYRYDQLNRIKQTNSYDGLSANSWQSIGSLSDKFKETFTYDFNGNIKTASRFNESATIIDNISYDYNISGGNLLNNKLDRVNEPSIPSSAFTYDLDDQTVGNYGYDNIGNLTADASEGIFNIDWTVYGKIKRITRTASNTNPDLEFVYDAIGNRIMKIVKPHASLNDPTTYIKTYYMRDAQGNVMAVYKQENVSGTQQLSIQEQNIYGSNRLGMLQNIQRVDVNNSILHKATFNSTSTEGWGPVGSSISVDGNNRLKVDLPANTQHGGTDYLVSGLLNGKTYEITFDIDMKNVGSNNFSALVLDYPGPGVFNEISKFYPVQGTNNYRFTARAGQSILKFQNNNANNNAYIFYVDNISVKEIDKNRKLGDKTYELSNHLGNVLTTVSDRKLGEEIGTPDGLVDIYSPEILSSVDYYVFGQAMPGKKFNPGDYKFGMNGQEKDVEIGEGIYGAEYWEYDSRLGRRWNTDPVVYPFESPYATFHNNPIYWSDPLGADGEGPNGECPGDMNEKGQIYGMNGITGKNEWTNPLATVEVQGNLNPAPSDFLTSQTSQNYLRNSGLDPSKVSIQFRPWQNMDSKQEYWQTKMFGSTYEMFYDGQSMGNFQFTDGPVWMRDINTDISAKIPGTNFANMDDLIEGWPGGEGIDLVQVAGEDMVNEAGGSGAGVKFSVLRKAQNVRFGTVNLNVKGNPYNSFLNQTGLISNSSTAKLYQQYKSTGILIYQNNRPVLKVSSKFEVMEAIKAGLEPAMGTKFDDLQNQAQEQFNQKTD